MTGTIEADLLLKCLRFLHPDPIMSIQEELVLTKDRRIKENVRATI